METSHSRIKDSQTLSRIIYSKWFPILTLSLLVLQVQWGLWKSLDLPTFDEAAALIEGAKLVRGEAITASLWGFSWWNSPLYIPLYALFFVITRSLEASFYIHRFLITLLSVIAFYLLLKRLLPTEFAWLGAAWIAVSPFFVDLLMNRSDFLAAASFAWLSLAIFRSHSKNQSILGFIFAIISALFRPEYYLFVIALAIYWVACTIYDRANWPRNKKLTIITSGILIISIILSIGGIVAIQLLPNVDTYLVWVFAHSRSKPVVYRNGFHEPMWISFERDFGNNRTIFGILSKPKNLFKDIKINTEIVGTFAKKMSTSTTWSDISLRANRWMVGILGLVIINVMLYRKKQSSFWREYWQKHSRDWMIILCLLPILTIYFILRPNNVWLLVITPLIIGPLILLIYAITRIFISRNAILFLIVVSLILVLAPNPRSFQGPQPVKKLINYFESIQSNEEPIKFLGNVSTTLCKYLTFDHINCTGDRWTDSDQYLTLEGFTSKSHYDYFIFDDDMKYLLEMDSGINQLVENQDNHWKLVYENQEYKVFKYNE